MDASRENQQECDAPTFIYSYSEKSVQEPQPALYLKKNNQQKYDAQTLIYTYSEKSVQEPRPVL